MDKKFIKLIMVTENNNNKFYDMKYIEGDFFEVEWGRVGQTSNKTIYPIKKWDSTYRSKTKKGYKDVTEVFAEVVTNNKKFSDINDVEVAMLVDTLQAYANKSVKSNYLVEAKNVTQKQVNEAQNIIDLISKEYTRKDITSSEINMFLTDLYSIIPRRMSNVKKHLFGNEYGIKFTPNDVEKVLNKEQETLDVMAGQVSMNTKTVDIKESETLLDAMGLKIENVNDEDIKTIKKLLGPNARQFKKAFRVINKETQKKFDSWLKEKDNKKTHLFWHGSRNENWWSILDTGLVLRPTNAVITGKMFGYGVYFADKAQKSIGYTSLRGSYWASGSDNKAYLALFEVHTGNWLHKKKHSSWMYDLNEKNLKKYGNYDSLFAEGGIDLRNNEYIVYNDAQCTVKYLVEIEG